MKLGFTLYDRGKLLVIDVDNINFVDNPDEAAQLKRTKTGQLSCHGRTAMNW
jgi:hypothetical protein